MSSYYNYKRPILLQTSVGVFSLLGMFSLKIVSIKTVVFVVFCDLIVMWMQLFDVFEIKTWQADRDFCISQNAIFFHEMIKGG